MSNDDSLKVSSLHGCNSSKVIINTQKINEIDQSYKLLSIYEGQTLKCDSNIA